MIELDPCTTRTVMPRKLAKISTRPVYAVEDGRIIGEHGEYATLTEYTLALPHMRPHVIVCHSPDTLLWRLHEYWQGHPQWSWRASVTNQHGKALQTKRVSYFGFRDSGRKANIYHLVLDANTFTRKQDHHPDDLLILGLTVRSFCNAHGLDLRTSAAGIALQLLRHPSFYPFARRRVPYFINEAARPHLPGGYYEAYADAGQRLSSVLYIDQEAAHHYAAANTPLPNSNSVRAIGHTRSNRVYARKGSTLYEREIRKHGLIKALVRVPLIKDTRFLPPILRTPGEHIAHVWTNELPQLESFGMEVLHIIGMWGTDEVDHGLAKYALWARDVQGRYPALKALLLMPYGLLARHRSNVTFHSPGGTDTLILANQLLTDTKSHRILTQPDTANALQLGLIQSFVRALSLDMARQLSERNHTVVSVYADGVFVKRGADGSVPLFAPWRVKGECPLELSDSLRVPVRARVQREYQAMKPAREESE